MFQSVFPGPAVLGRWAEARLTRLRPVIPPGPFGVAGRADLQSRPAVATLGGMPVIRPVRDDDVAAMAELSALSGGELTTLPADSDLLERRVRHSAAAFAADVDRPGGELYTFVLEDPRDPRRLLGTAAVVSKTGGFEPFYCYDVRDERYQSDLLGVDRRVRSLHLVEDHSGPAEVGGLFLRPEARGTGAGRLLAVARFLFMAGRPRSFDPRVVAEVRGVTDAGGNSPFWDAIGRLFFGVGFPVADAMSFKEKQVIADLMPDHPIYVDMIPPAARAVIGVEHEHARPARRLLEGEGFAFRNRVDIFDAGPMLEADLPSIRAVARSRVAEVAATGRVDGPADGRADGGAEVLVCNDRLDFRAVPTPIGRRPDGTVVLPPDAADALEVRPGERVRYAPIRP